MSKEKVAKPLGDRGLIKELDSAEKEKKTAGGIILPDSVRNEDVKTAKVVSVGPGIYTQSGTKIPMSVEVGDEVIMPPYNQAQEVTLNGEKYLLLRESELLMVIK